MALFKREKKVRCHLLENNYDAFVGANILHQAGNLIAKHTKVQPGQVVVITTRKISNFYEKVLKASLKRAGFKPTFHYVIDGEGAKSEKVYFSLLKSLAKAQFERGSLVIALGGGVIGDLAGFVAATYMRGVPFINIPTTLLAQVDSSIGGKTGINLKEGKNLVGSFYQPKLVLADIATITTLPQAQVVNGLAEVIKYAVLFDEEFFEYLEENIEAILDLDLDIIEKVVFRCVQFKVRIVERDEKEGNVRAILNLGHTFGHAIEAYSGYKSTMTHGMAVALGMQAAGRLASRIGMFDDALLERLIELIRKAQLPTSLAKYRFDKTKLIRLMQSDKKVQKKKIRFILPMEIGNVIIRDDVSTVQIKQALSF